MKLAFITDEVTQNFAEAVAFARENGLQGLEVRSVDDTPADRLSAQDLRECRLRADDAGLAVCNVAGSFFKCAPQADRAAELEKLRRLCAAADALGCRTVRGFALLRPASGALGPEALAEALAPAGPILRAAGMRLLLEADPGVNTSNHAALAAVLALLDPACFAAVYDAGNDLFDPLGERPFPDAYEHIRPYLAHVHVKDAVRRGGDVQCVAPGTGQAGWPAILARLHADRYGGWLSLEPHYRKGRALTEEQMRLPQGAAFTEGGREAGRESAAALRALLRREGWAPEVKA